MPNASRSVQLIGLHGFTRNGGHLKRHLEPLISKLPDNVSIQFPDGTWECSEEQVRRNYRRWGAPIPDGPHRRWWDASADGRNYHGLEKSVEALKSLVGGCSDSALPKVKQASRPPLGLIGFSQGAIFAAVLAALSQAGEFPPIDFAVFLAGAPPRDSSLQDYFGTPLTLSTLHVWGTGDPMSSKHCPALVSRCDSSRAEVLTWRGGHRIPRDQETIGRVAQFIAAHAAQ